MNRRYLRENLKVAIVYDRVNKWGGAERVLLSLQEIFPEAILYTSLYSREAAIWGQKFLNIIPSKLNKIPFLRLKHEYLSILMPSVFESFEFTDFDLVISVTSESAKGILTSVDTKHICYCLTPTRYLWSHNDFYFSNKLLKNIFSPLISYLRRWDKIAAQRPDVMIAISTEVQNRIQKYYGRESHVIFPPLNFKYQIFNSQLPNKNSKKKYYLIVSRLVKYKRVDMAIEAFNELGLPLYIIGQGKEERILKKMAKSNIKFLGQLTDESLARYYIEAEALVFPQHEDFGLVAVEAIASGTPVIAYKAGGSIDILIPGVNGTFFEKQNKESLKKAVRKFDRSHFDSNVVSRSANKFSKDRFKREFLNIVKSI